MHKRIAVTLRCRSWCCDECQPRRRARLIAEVHRGRPDTFITFTIRRDATGTPEQAARDLTHAWSLLTKRARREAARNIDRCPTPFGAAPEQGYKRDHKGRVARQVNLIGGKLDYFGVIEATQSGWPHIHVMCRSHWIAQAWLSAQMQDLIASPIVHIERITNKSKAAAYVAKYAGKAPHKFGSAKRYWQSRGFKIVPRRDRCSAADIPGRWERHDQSVSQWAHSWQQQGWSAHWLSEDRCMVRAPP